MGKKLSTIATYPNLSDATLYTRQCMRRILATLLEDSCADLATVKRLGKWKSTSVAEDYIEFSVKSKLNIARQILADYRNRL